MCSWLVSLSTCSLSLLVWFNSAETPSCNQTPCYNSQLATQNHNVPEGQKVDSSLLPVGHCQKSSVELKYLRAQGVDCFKLHQVFTVHKVTGNTEICEKAGFVVQLRFP